MHGDKNLVYKQHMQRVFSHFLLGAKGCVSTVSYCSTYLILIDEGSMTDYIYAYELSFVVYNVSENLLFGDFSMWTNA